MVRENISRKEAECPHCGVLPSNWFLDLLQKLRTAYGKPLHFTSMYRCSVYNRRLKGYRYSVHMVNIANAAYGGTDIRIGRYHNRKRWVVYTLALKLGFNNLEVCDRHIHIGRVPDHHPGYNKIIWGISK